ncbi:MAG: c-type cytochrome, partial [Anaerolineales bacterium]|nr:c-type cytochrome [Anaerolineales bacterium]
RGGDVLSAPPGVPVVVPGSWADSKLRARLRDNRMPPGWEFDIEETNRDGPLVSAGKLAADTGDTAEIVPVAAAVEPVAPAPPELPPPTITERVERAEISLIFLGLLGGLAVVFGVVMAFIYFNRLRTPTAGGGLNGRVVESGGFMFSGLGVLLGGLVLHGIFTGAFTETKLIHEVVPTAVEVAPIIPNVGEVRVEEWQARLPEPYAALSNPFANDADAARAGQALFDEYDCSDCHGITLAGDGELSVALSPRPVNLTDPALMNLPFMTDTYLFWRISEGGTQPPFFSAMPAWKHLIPEQERWQLVTFVRSQTAAAPIDEGEQAAIAIIEQAGCFACHRLDHLGRGGKLGPSWSELPAAAAGRIANLPAEDYVRQSILQPAAFIVPGYEEGSVMPSNFGELLTPEEIDMLVAYLLQEK